MYEYEMNIEHVMFVRRFLASSGDSFSLCSAAVHQRRNEARTSRVSRTSRREWAFGHRALKLYIVYASCISHELRVGE